MKKILLLLLPALIIGSAAIAQKKITFPSKDDVTITADEYIVNDSLPYLVLCHQAGASRGEYSETAKKFNKLGFNCLAIDQRSGNTSNGVINETAKSADAKKKAVTYLDAEQDIIAAIDYLSTKTKEKIILVGSSYSASLVLKIATTNDKVSAVLAFSPGEYFGKTLKLKDAIKNLDKPVFVTSSKNEAAGLTELVKDVKSGSKTQFTPNGNGEHGSKALWKASADNKEYWLSVLLFLKQARES